jgi:transcriptional regulator with PAS, ATPase and Fis domain
VAVNCGAISPALAESELFGHRKGAFTGAQGDRKGLVRSAEGGVLFLDEISEMELPLQAKLLRVLQDNRVLGVGDDEEVGVDVRVLAASNRDLEEMVRQQKFRADLFHRVNVLSVRLPSLRERPDDMLPLLRHFLRKHGPERAEPVGVEREVLDALTQVSLPGNVRELENLVRGALIHKQDDAPLRLSDLPAAVWRQLADVGTTPPSESIGSVEAPAGRSFNLAGALQVFEKRLIEAALSSAHGNQTETARLLGITPRSVYNKLRKYQLTMRADA